MDQYIFAKVTKHNTYSFKIEAGQMFGGCGNDTVCSNTDIDLECGDDEESKETGLFGTCTPDLVDFSTVTFGNRTVGKGNHAIFFYYIYF